MDYIVKDVGRIWDRGESAIRDPLFGGLHAELAVCTSIVGIERLFLG